MSAVLFLIFVEQNRISNEGYFIFRIRKSRIFYLFGFFIDSKKYA